MKLKYKIFLAVYQFFRTARYTLLKSVFGLTIHCKHSPTCGTFTFNQVRKRGIIIGTIKGLKKVLTCW